MEKLGPGDPLGVSPGVELRGRSGAYRLLARLGAGGMGNVYLARSDRGRTVAVKLVRQELAEQEEFRARFRQEVQAARQVGGYWTAPVLDADTEADIPWVATGYVAGPSLQAVVGSDHGALPERTVRILAAGLAHALEDIHAAGLIHRDLKPSNVLVTIDGPRVIDFGIARALETVTDGGLTRTGALVGSPGFMAPEQVRGDRITPACDVFCLGSVLSYAATGNLPFGAANSGVHALMFRIAEEEPDLTGLPEGLYDLVRDCLRKDPAARPTLAQILQRTGAEDTVFAGRSRDPWLPSALVAQLGRHAVQLLNTEDPEEAAPEGEGPHGPGAAGAAGAPAGWAGQGSPGAAGAPEGAEGTGGPAEGGRPGAPDLTKRPSAAAAGHAEGTPGHGPDEPEGGAVPPPPGTPGSAPLDRLPTQVVRPGSQPLPPASPPGPAPYGFPHRQPAHPQSPAGYGQPPATAPGYGYPQGAPQGQAGYGTYGQPPYADPQPYGGQAPAPYGGQQPYGGQPAPGAAGGLGATPPYGPTPLQGPGGRPRPDRSGGRRSSVVLVAVALVVALGAGGSVYALMKKGEERGKENDGKGGPTTSGPETPGPTTPEPTDPETSPDPTTESPDAGTVPEDFLGTWNATLSGSDGSDTRQLVIRQGEVGDTVLSLTADGPLAAGGTYHCVFEAELSEAPDGDGPLRIGPSRVTEGEPATSCSPGAATTVTLLPDGRLRRVDTAGKSVTYTKG
ncbi:serine/threonine-protein kinase [Streptomyces sp. HM190]|uniref:serine/threonine-protein kinase n=1 Tax=Streptomyces sp. HM190 TaxID=2695266 RepID=UPI00135B0854|nr:serine/threonine-protein kinase [Streptomyces sp. HM190]